MSNSYFSRGYETCKSIALIKIEVAFEYDSLFRPRSEYDLQLLSYMRVLAHFPDLNYVSHKININLKNTSYKVTL